MARVADALPGERFYFANNKSAIFTMLRYMTRRSGYVHKCKCMQEGKVHPTYLAAYNEVIIIKNLKNVEEPLPNV